MANAAFMDLVKVPANKKSTFDLSYDHKTSFQMGQLIPVGIQEVVPSDVFRISTEAVFRMMPMSTPPMDIVECDFHHFFVPSRILWDGFEHFMAGNPDGVTPRPPMATLNTLGSLYFTPGSLGDYMGYPVGKNLNGDIALSALPMAAYQRVWYDYYRDENLQAMEFPKLQSGQQTTDVSNWLQTLRFRAWEKDVFTASLPFPQKGPQVSIPIDITSPTELQVQLKSPDDSGFPKWRDKATGAPVALNATITTDGSGNVTWKTTTPVASGLAYYDPEDTMYVDPTSLQSSSSINDLRKAYALQTLFERMARGGTRFFEFIRSMFGVRSPDARYQRAEYICGQKSTMAMSEVLQTSASTGVAGDTPQGNMAGHGISLSSGRPKKFFVPEYGYIVTMMSVKPKTGYMQGLPKMFSKISFTDYLLPDLAEIGEQPVLNKELYYDRTDGQNENTFGYMPQYYEYRTNFSRASGQMRTTLDNWHFVRKFDARPNLNEAFIVANPTQRVFAVTDELQDKIVAHVFFRIKAKRPLSLFGTPSKL